MSYYQPIQTKHNYGYEYFLTWATRYADENAMRWERGMYTKPSDRAVVLAERIAQRNNRILRDRMIEISPSYCVGTVYRKFNTKAA